MSSRGETQAIVCTQLDAARRQINTAVWFWFNGGDIVSVHTLAAAAHRTIIKLSGSEAVPPFPFDRTNLPDDLREEMFQDPDTFLRPAKDDPNGTLDLKPLWTELYLFVVISAYMEFAID